jgi:ATP-dependent Clp protease ATP-binding subunit ClpC
MLERFSEKARRVIFFGRYEASQYGSPCIETEHLLLGLFREDKAFVTRFFRIIVQPDSIRKQIEGRIKIRERISASVQIPLSVQSKRVLAAAAEEADRLSNEKVGTEHLLLGLLLEENSLASEILRGRGLEISVVREQVARMPHDKVAGRPSPEAKLLLEGSRDLTQEAMDGKLSPVFGRDDEISGLMEVLCSFTHKNPILIGERGVGKTAIVEGLAQRMADGDVPVFLTDMRILTFDHGLTAAPLGDRKKLEEKLNAIVKELLKTSDAIIFIEELQSLIATGPIVDSLSAAEILKPALLSGEIQCITASTAIDYQKSIQAVPWLKYCFRTVNVFPLDEEKTLMVLQGCKGRYEKFHQVTYTDEALMLASQYSIRHFPVDGFLAKAMEMLDAAGSRVKLRQSLPPEEVSEALKRVKYNIHRMETAIANHDFEKARFYSEEERKQKELLRQMREHLKLDESVAAVVCKGDIEDVVSRWTGVPIESLRQENATTKSSSAGHADVNPNSGETQKRPSLRVFMCHSSKDKPRVRDLYMKLKDKHIDPWLDEENLLPGQEWDFEIDNAVRSCHVVIVCLSAYSVTKSGYLQREIRKVLDVADEQPEGAIYLIPLKFEECDVPNRLRRWQWVNFFEPKGFERLIQALLERARAVGLNIP